MPIKLQDGRVVSFCFTTNKARSIVEQDEERAARRLLAGEVFEMHCSGLQIYRVQQIVDRLLQEAKMGETLPDLGGGLIEKAKTKERREAVAAYLRKHGPSTITAMRPVLGLSRQLLFDTMKRDSLHFRQEQRGSSRASIWHLRE